MRDRSMLQLRLRILTFDYSDFLRVSAAESEAADASRSLHKS